MYTVAQYGDIIGDRVRTDAYAKALRCVVRPGDVVVDLGAGTGIMSLIAARLGAARVYAIDPNEALAVARTSARVNGFADRILFFQARSNAVTLPERADVIVADVHGVLPALSGSIGALMDARDRFLKPGGIIIPEADVLCAAVAEAPDQYERLFCGWEYDGFDVSSARLMVANSWDRNDVDASQLLTPPAQCAVLHYPEVREDRIAGSAHLEASRTGTAHALSVWYDCHLRNGVSYTNGPGRRDSVFGQAFFPLLNPVAVEAGDRIDLELRADFVHDDYVWSWNTRVRSPGGQIKAEFRQSTFHGAPLAGHLRKRSDAFTPQLSHDGVIDRAILELFDRGLTLRYIANEMVSRFPADFGDWKTALDRVAMLSARYSD